MVTLYLPQQTNTCSKSAKKTLKIIEDNSNENIFKKQHRMCSKKSSEKPVPESLFQ